MNRVDRRGKSVSTRHGRAGSPHRNGGSDGLARQPVPKTAILEGRFWKVATPLGIALALTGTFFGLLFVQGRKASPVAGVATAPAAPSAEPRKLLDVPRGDPSDPHAYEAPAAPPERFEGKYPRWNIGEYPDGWDDAIAAAIHGYFEAMTYGENDLDKIRNLEKVRAEIAAYLAGLGPEAIPTLGAILNMEGDFVNRRFLLHALGDLGPRSEEATYVLSDFLLSRCQDPRNRSELGHVIEAMGRLQNESSFTRLTDFITLNGEQYGEYSELHSYRRHLIEALGEHPRREEAAGTFIACLRDDPLPNVRNKAAQALGKVQSPETLNDLYVSFDREPHWVARQTILGSIGKIGNPNSVPFLEAQARNAREAAIRLSAAGALRHINTEHARSVLHELERSEPDPNVRKNITKFAAEADGKAADR